MFARRWEGGADRAPCMVLQRRRLCCEDPALSAPLRVEAVTSAADQRDSASATMADVGSWVGRVLSCLRSGWVRDDAESARAPRAGALASGALLAVLAALACAPTVLAARRVAVVPEYLSQGPVFVGGQIAWMEHRCLRACGDDRPVNACAPPAGYFVKTTRQGRPVRTLASGRTDCVSRSAFSHVEFAVSRTRFAVERGSSFGDDTANTAKRGLWAGPLGGELSSVYRCSSGSYSPESLFLLADDDLLFDPEPCRESVRRLSVRDLAGGGTASVPVASNSQIFSVKFTGRYLAYLRAPATGPYDVEQIVVYDRQAQSNAYTVEFDPASDQSFALRADGTVAVIVPDRSTRSCASDRFEWYSPAEPYAHPLAVEGCYGSPAFAGDRLLYSSDANTLEIGTLAGGGKTVARFGNITPDGLDANSTRIVYGLLRCAGGSSIYNHKLDDPPVSAGAASCPTRVRSPRVTLRGGRAIVRLACPRGCNGRLQLRRGGDAIADRSFGATRRAAAQGIPVRLLYGVVAGLPQTGRPSVQIRLKLSDRALRTRRLTRSAVLIRK